MKPLSIIVLLFSLSLFFIQGCSPKRTVRPADEQTETQQTGASSEEGRESLSGEGKGPSENITERQLSELKEGEGIKDGREIESGLRDIYFDFDSYAVREDAKPALRKLAAALSRDKKLKAIIEGYCDDRGTTEYNLGLGDRRALAVKSYLVSLGIPSSKIETISYGEEKPLCTEQTEDCWTKNRRAHFVLIEGEK
ncbi:MAG: peptidoglycan-associated lipoprotein Pal [Thermodesulfovibrionales bacterium]|jgi:peptidoglycan-associated lipoprotein